MIEAPPTIHRTGQGTLVSSPSGATTTGRDDAPVTRRERIQTLDIVRGFALLGILAVNIESFAGPFGFHDLPIGLVKPAFVGWHAQLDMAIVTFKWLFVEGKMRALFAMLFGASAVLLTDRIERRAGAAHARMIFLRRNALLLLFGLVHGILIWEGDILSSYALCGLLVPLFLRRLQGRYLVALGLSLCLIAATIGIPRYLNMMLASPGSHQSGMTPIIERFTQPHDAAQIAAFQAKDQAEKEKMNKKAVANVTKVESTGYVQSRLPQAEGYLEGLLHIIQSGFILEIIGPIVLGMGLYKLGFFSGLLSTRTYALMAIGGYAISVPIVLVGMWNAQAYGFSRSADLFWLFLPYTFEQVPGAIANAATVLLCVRMGWFRAPFARLGAIGQTAFSNYILTSVICQFIFVWGPWKLYGTLEYYQGLYVTAAIWALNLIISPIWLRYFAFGPLEWVWRSLTYGRWQPLRLAR